MASLATYSLMQLAESIEDEAAAETNRAGIEEIERLERQRDRLITQLEEHEIEPDPGV